MLSLRVTISLLLYYYHCDYYYYCCYCSLYLLLLPVGFVHAKVHIAQPMDDVMWGKVYELHLYVRLSCELPHGNDYVACLFEMLAQIVARRVESKPSEIALHRRIENNFIRILEDNYESGGSKGSHPFYCAFFYVL